MSTEDELDVFVNELIEEQNNRKKESQETVYREDRKYSGLLTEE